MDDEHVSPIQDAARAGGIVQRELDHNQFIAVLAHELRNPIAPIRSGLDLLATGQLPEAARHSTIAIMQRQLSQLASLMDDLLDSARLSTGILPFKAEAVRLRDVVQSAIESIEPALSANQQSLTSNGADLDTIVMADPVRLAQAFTNILASNVKRTPGKGTIEIDMVADEETIVLTFADQGPALDIEQARNVFVLFPPERTQGHDDGLSIGLALVKGLIEANGGTVQVHNRPANQGSIFTVELPVSDSSAGAAESEQEPMPNMHWRSHRLLVVDDNRDAAETLGLLFELDGMTVRLAHDGPSAVAEACDFRPEMVVMDIGLPGFDGLEAVRQIRALNLEVHPYIVALTGWGTDADRLASQQAGVDLHLVKPVSYEDLSVALTASARPPEATGESAHN